MPFASQRQRRYMKARHPDIADRWREESGPQRDLPERSRGRKRKRGDARQKMINQFLQHGR